MANLIEIGEDLESVPDAELAAMINNPDSKYPVFMVVSEVQRRAKFRKMYENEVARMNQPQTTVVEEAVMGLMQGQGAMPMQAGMSSPVNSQGSGLQGMAPPTLTAQTGLFTSQEQLIARLKRLAEQGDINAQRELQQLTQRLGGISDFVFDETKVDLSATMPSASLGSGFNPEVILSTGESFDPPTRPPFTREYSISSPSASEPLMTLPKDLTEGFPYQRPQFKNPVEGLSQLLDARSELAEKTRESILARGFLPTDRDISVPPESLLGRAETAVTPFIDEAKSGLKSYFATIPSTLQMPGGGDFKLGPFEGLFGSEKAQASELTSGPTDFRDAVNRAKTDLAGGKARIGDDQPIVPDATAQQVVSTNQPDEPPLTFQDVLAKIRGDEQQPVFEGLSQQNQQLLQQLRNKASDNTDVLGLTKETLERLPIPKLDLPEVTEEDRQKELSAYTLSSLAKIISGARNVSDIGKGLGEAGIGLQALKKQQKKEQRQALIDSQKEDIRRFGIASSLASSQLAQDQARLQGQISLANLESALTNHEFNRAKTEELAKRANDKFALDVFNVVEGSKFNKDKLEILKQQALAQSDQNNLKRVDALIKLVGNIQAEMADFTSVRTRFPDGTEGDKQFKNFISKRATEMASLEREINNLLGVQDIVNEALASAQTFVDTI